MFPFKQAFCLKHILRGLLIHHGKRNFNENQFKGAKSKLVNQKNNWKPSI